jgi:hypothetical protein
VRSKQRNFLGLEAEKKGSHYSAGCLSIWLDMQSKQTDSTSYEQLKADFILIFVGGGITHARAFC